MAVDAKMSDAWLEAGSRLLIRVFAPFQVALPDGSTVEVEAFLPDFGGPSGIVAMSLEDEERSKRAADGGMYLSLIGPEYRRFDEILFRETLDDWGWFGAESARPIWYTGRPWS